MRGLYAPLYPTPTTVSTLKGGLKTFRHAISPEPQPPPTAPRQQTAPASAATRMALLAAAASRLLLSSPTGPAAAWYCASLLAAVRHLRTSGTAHHQAQQPAQQQQQQQASRSTAEVGRLNHVAIAVPDLAAAAERYRSVLGARVSEPQPVPEHGVTVVFVELPNAKIELLHPLGEASPISKFLARNPGGGIHHVCLEVADVTRSLSALQPAVRVLDPTPKIGAHGNPVVFLHPKDNDGVLMELEEVGENRELDL